MRPTDEFPLDPDIVAELDAIDATLRGDPVDPQFAEIAELALIVTADRPRPTPEFAAALDERVARRFTPAPAAAAARADRQSDRGDRGPARRGWASRLVGWPAAGGFATAVAAVIVVFVVSGGSSSPPIRQGASSGGASFGTSNSAASTSASSTSASSTTAPTSTAASSAASSVPRAAAPNVHKTAAGTVSGNKALTTPSPTASSAAASAANTAGGSVQPPANGRRIVQSALLQLTALATRVDDVSQELFNVIGSEHGIVNRSSVTATGGLDGYANFSLSVPSANLADTMRQLSSLRYAKVASRTDNSQDVNGEYVSDQNKLADAQALRTGLLKQLAAATTQAEIDSLNARIHDAENVIAADQRTIRILQHRIAYSTVSVTINAASAPPVTHTHSSGGGFTLRRAVHDAGRVLTVAAGVALITLAALVPIGLVVALALWIGTTVRQRRREHALDVA